MIIGKINDDVYIDDAVLWKTKPKVVINNQEITDLETFNKVVDSIKEKDKEIERLNNIIKIMEKYFELIIDLGYDYDGFNQVDSLKGLIDELVRYANLGRVYNITEPISEGIEGKKYNIIGEELKGSDDIER